MIMTEIDAAELTASVNALKFVKDFFDNEAQGYRNLVLVYAGYCIETLKDENVIRFLPDKFLVCPSAGRYNYAWIHRNRIPLGESNLGIRIEDSSKGVRVLFGVYLEAEEGPVGTADKFASAVVRSFTPKDETKEAWEFRAQLDEISIPAIPQAPTDIYRERGSCWAERDLRPQDFVDYPRLLRLFASSLNRQINEAREQFLQGEKLGDLAAALKSANEILSSALQ